LIRGERISGDRMIKKRDQERQRYGREKESPKAAGKNKGKVRGKRKKDDFRRIRTAKRKI